ncbi:hypothetical protein FH972_025373 [Carpinus fangiana]|uniref:DUF761 domain-containing protein n=1 Tax=Carpinus fangiana TaxID=176857 RepID=A0A5N6L185_9ROSI|nr:hypothetical protein FH972_025373 [Carpinus fangiana]
MSRSSLGKKLCHAKKAWKCFTITLQSKLHKLRTSRAIKAATRRLLAIRSFRFLFPFKRHNLINKPSSSYYQYGQQYYYHQAHKNFAAIHIDELYDQDPVAGHSKSTLHARAGTSKGKEVVDDKSLPRKSESIYGIEDAWKQVVASSPHLRGVDDRAEEFISRFHQDMKLQKERSLLEFQEMLARSA